MTNTTLTDSELDTISTTYHTALSRIYEYEESIQKKKIDEPGYSSHGDSEPYPSHIKRNYSRVGELSLPTIENVRRSFEDLNGCVDEGTIFKSVSIETVDKKTLVCVTTADITIGSTQLGAYIIKIHIDAGFRCRAEGYFEYAVSILPVLPRKYPNVSNIHPHVSGSGLCFGDGYLAQRLAHIKGDVLGMFLNVKSILDTYNDSSPYTKLHYFVQELHTCVDCKEKVLPEDSRACPRCSNKYCKDCKLAKCTKCDSITCNKCSYKDVMSFLASEKVEVICKVCAAYTSRVDEDFSRKKFVLRFQKKEHIEDFNWNQQHYIEALLEKYDMETLQREQANRGCEYMELGWLLGNEFHNLAVH